MPHASERMPPWVLPAVLVAGVVSACTITKVRLSTYCITCTSVYMCVCMCVFACVCVCVCVCSYIYIYIYIVSIIRLADHTDVDSDSELPAKAKIEEEKPQYWCGYTPKQKKELGVADHKLIDYQGPPQFPLNYALVYILYPIYLKKIGLSMTVAILTPCNPFLLQSTARTFTSRCPS
jgi:hypothetical protein